MTDIAACPFCCSKNDPKAQQLGPSVFDEGGRAFVGCVQCGARGPMLKGDDYTRDSYVIGRWNARAEKR